MAEEEKKPKRDLGKVLALAFVVLNLAVTGGGAFLVYSSTLGYKHASVANEDLDKELNEFRESLRTHPVIYTMDTFNTNLDGVPRRFIRVRVNLEMLDEEGFEEVINLGAEARDAVVRILNSKSYDELETVQGKLHLKSQIVGNLNAFLDRGVVQNVYFSDFAVQ